MQYARLSTGRHINFYQRRGIIMEVFVIVIIIIAILTSKIINEGTKEDIKEEIETIEQQKWKDSILQPIEINTDEKEYKIELLKQIQNININLINLQNRLEIQEEEIKNIEKMTDDIKFSNNCIAFFILIPIIIKIIMLIAGVHTISEIF